MKQTIQKTPFILREQTYTKQYNGARTNLFALIIFTVNNLVLLTTGNHSYFLSKNQKVGWLIFAFVFFALDTVWMIFYFGDIGTEMLIDIFFHTWMLINLSIGIIAHFKLKKLAMQVTAP